MTVGHETVKMKLNWFLPVLILIFATATCALATVPTDASRVAGPYSCDGNDTTFTFGFGIIDDDDLEVVLVTVATGVETTLVKTNQYAISSANTNDPLDFRKGGTVTTVTAHSSDYTIRLQSDTARTQLTNIDDEEVEESLDKITYMIQDLYAYLSRLAVGDANLVQWADYEPSDFQSADSDLISLAAGILGIVKGLGNGNGYTAAVEGTDYLGTNRIDDTKGDGDTDYLWSAHKIYNQFADLTAWSDIDPDEYLDTIFSSTGILVRTAANTYTTRTIAGTANQITVADGNGVAGNPTLSLPGRLSGVSRHPTFNIPEPNKWYDRDTEICIRVKTPAALTITGINITCNADPDSELDWNLKYADAFIGLANAATLTAMNTTNGTYSSGVVALQVPANKCIYVSFDARPDADIKQVCVDITYDYD